MFRVVNFDFVAATKTIANIMKDYSISREELLAAFPERPTTQAQFEQVAAWIGERVNAKTASPSPTSPQVKLEDAHKNWVSKDKNNKNRPMYFAVKMDGKPHFFRVKPGYKAGVWFVEEQASDDLYPVQSRRRRERILGLIFQDAAAAQAMYGQLIGRCARCRKQLTDHSNPYFAMGLGPECGSK